MTAIKDCPTGKLWLAYHRAQGEMEVVAEELRRRGVLSQGVRTLEQMAVRGIIPPMPDDGSGQDGGMSG